MATFEWTTRLAVGFPEMDEQHQQLIALMNQLQAGVDAGAPADQLLVLLGELGELAVRHFDQEERVMVSINYPALDLHRIMHQSLIERFMAHRDELAQTGSFTPEFSEFLFRWLTSHICGPDTKYGVYSGQLTSRNR